MKFQSTVRLLIAVGLSFWTLQCPAHKPKSLVWLPLTELPNNDMIGTTSNLKISQVQTRGDAGGNDEFIEIFNPTSETVGFDNAWTISVRSATGTCSPATSTNLLFGSGQKIPPYGHILLTNDNALGYNGSILTDLTYASGIPDAASLTLYHGNSIVDRLCLYYDASTLNTLTTCGSPYGCEGKPVQNNHNNTSATNIDSAIQRLLGGASGNCTDTDDNSLDFAAIASSLPHNLASSPTICP